MNSIDTWEQMKSWHLVLPPSRPSTFHLETFRRIIRERRKDVPVLVLGSTPELRDLLIELNFKNIFVIDWNKNFHAQVEFLRVYKNNETFVNADWFEALPQFANTFQLILSDLTIGNISYEKRILFYDLLSQSLKKGGLFIDKVLFHTGRNIPLNLLDKKYSRLPLNLLHINHFSCEYFFCSQLLSPESPVDSSYFYSELQSRFANPRLLSFLKQCELITPKGCLWYYGKLWHDVTKTYCNSLKRVATIPEETSSPYAKRMSIMVSKKDS